MIAKLIAYGKTRDHAIRKMRRALDEFVVEGVDTTIPFHLQLMDDERFQNGNFDTRFLDDFEMERPPSAA
jgi:acetyl-CoA carboxylase biotin carboxylase subunit